MRQTALVVEASRPLDNRLRLGADLGRKVRILVQGPSPIYTAAEFKFSEDQWLVRGAEVPIEIDPERPEDFEIVWEGVPSISERAAANDPALADPVSAHRQILAALVAAGVAGIGKVAPGRTASRTEEAGGEVAAKMGGGILRKFGMGGLAEKAQQGMQLALHTDPGATALQSEAELLESGDMNALFGRYESVREETYASAAPPGKTRAVVLIATQRVTVKGQTSSDGTPMGNYDEAHGKHETVLSVRPHGQDPYTVYLPKWDHKKGKATVVYGMPALVSDGDPNEVEVQWAEMRK